LKVESQQRKKASKEKQIRKSKHRGGSDKKQKGKERKVEDKKGH